MCCDEGMQNFRQHDFPLFRVPNICANPEYEKLSSVNLKFQWVDPDTGTWKEGMSQRVHIFNGEDTPQQIKTGMNVFAILTQTQYTDSESSKAPNWLRRGLRQTVKRINYDHLNQTQTLRNVPLKSVPWPDDNTVDDNRTRLRAAVNGKGNTVFDKKPTMPSGRQSCDLCSSLMMVSYYAKNLLNDS